MLPFDEHPVGVTRDLVRKERMTADNASLDGFVDSPSGKGVGGGGWRGAGRWLRRLAGMMLVVAVQCAGMAAERLPNIVFILADDLGWADLGCQGSGYYETPHVDRLAAQGMRFTHAYSAGPNCQPSRAALMTGQYGPRTGIYTVGNTNRFDWSMRPLLPVANTTVLAPESVTIAEVLRKEGYATGLFGKWHLGSDPAHHPLAQGFDEALAPGAAFRA